MGNKYSARGFFPVAFAAIVLAGCGASPPPAKKAKMKPDHDLVAAIRAAGDKSASAVEVQPLRDPAVEGFLKHAAELEAQGKFKQAMSEVDRALAVAPNAPELLQYQAELQVGRRKYAEAEALARKSYELGPRLGSLCARNWQTVIETRRLANDTASVDSAKAQQTQCRIAPPVRM